LRQPTAKAENDEPMFASRASEPWPVSPMARKIFRLHDATGAEVIDTMPIVRIRHHRITRFVASTTVLAAAIVSSCGSTKPSSSATTTGSPFADLFGNQDQQKERQRKIEAGTAQCMKDKGWTYSPQDVDRMFGTNDFSSPEGIKTFREKYGYGIANQPPPEEMGGGAITDPNGDYVGKLSEADRNQYYKDLEGFDTTSPQEQPTGPQSLADRKGCRADGERAAGAQLYDDPKYQKVFESLGSAFENDPRIGAAEAKWSACMKDAGFTYTNTQKVVEDLQGRMTVLQGGVPGEGGGFVATTAAAATASGSSDTSAGSANAPGATFAGGGDPGFTPKEPDPVELKKLQADELAVAKADDICAKKYLEKIQKQVEKEQYDKIIKEFPELKKK
jgi:hypothetical protein